MTYREAVKDLSARHMFGIKLGLQNITNIMERLGNPQREFQSVHIAGTNGKGSTAAILSSLFTAQGLTTGLYTSPHISSVRERFRINGSCIKPAEFAELYSEVIQHINDIPATFFEITTALAFLYFRRQNADAAAIEVGMGGKFDATNIIIPDCSIITNIGYDHQEYLGSTLEQITGEKCGIIKQNIPVVSGVELPELQQIITKIAQERDAPLYESRQLVRLENVQLTPENSTFDVHVQGTSIKQVSFPLAGAYQLANIRTALAAYAVVNGGDIKPHITHIKKGLSETVWAERFSLYRKNPTVIIDVAHNESGFRALTENIMKLFPGKKVLLMVGMKADKNCRQALAPILPLCREGIGIPISGEKGISPHTFRDVFSDSRVPFYWFRSVRSAAVYAYSQVQKNEIIVCAGSHYIIHSVKNAIKYLD